VVAGLTASLVAVASNAGAALAGDINGNGVATGDETTGLAVEVDTVSGLAKTATDGGAGLGFAVDNLNVKGVKLDLVASTPAVTEVQDVTKVGALASLDKLSGKLQSPFVDCTSDLVEVLGAGAFAGLAGLPGWDGGAAPGPWAGKSTTDEYPLSGKLTLGWNANAIKSQAYVTGVSTPATTFGDVVALEGIVIKGPGLGAQYISENAFTITAKGTADTNANGKIDGGVLEAQRKISQSLNLNAADQAALVHATMVDTDGDGLLTTDPDGGFAFYDADGDDEFGIVEGGTGENVVSDACVGNVNDAVLNPLNATNIQGTANGVDGPDADATAPFTLDPFITGAGFTALPIPVVTGANAPSTSGDAILSISFTTDGPTQGPVLDSQITMWFAE
jgi:hypothetical protein